MSDRTMATDAMATLGTAPLDDTARRDAIHLAVMPALAGESLGPGDHITVVDGLAWRADEDDKVDPPLGIVDPFVRRVVKKGERFWVVLYPRTIQSLRHVWTHPAFPDEPAINPGIAQAVADISKRADSERWLREFCDRSDCPSYEYVMKAIEDGNAYEHSLHVGREASGEIPPEFWDHVEVILGRSVPHRPAYFSCSC